MELKINGTKPSNFPERPTPLSPTDNIQFQDATGDWQRPVSDLMQSGSPLFREVFSVESDVITSIYCNNPDGSIILGASTDDREMVINFDYTNYVILFCCASFLPMGGYQFLTLQDWNVNMQTGYYRLCLYMGDQFYTNPVIITIEYIAVL